MMCFWIFHDWKEVESWEHNVVDGGKRLWRETCIIGSECRKCGRRKIRKCGTFGDAAAGPFERALNWMKEEVLR